MKTLRTGKVAPARSSASIEIDTAGAPRVHRPAAVPRGLRMRTFIRRGALDRRLAEGCGVSSPELALRALQLTAPASRRALAESIRRAVRSAERAPQPYSAVMLDRTAVKYGRAALHDLADQLELAHHVTPRGVLLVRRLMTHCLSPMYDPGAKRTVTEVAREIQDVLQVRPASAALAV